MKGVIAATNLCFAEKGIYTSEVLAIVLTQLLEVCNLVLPLFCFLFLAKYLQFSKFRTFSAFLLKFRAFRGRTTKK